MATGDAIKPGLEKFEIKRKLFHAALGIGLVILMYFGALSWLGSQLPLPPGLPLPARPLLFALALGLILVPLSRRYRVPGIYWFLRNLERPELMRTFPGRGAFFYILGALLVILLDHAREGDGSIAMASIMILALGDPASKLARGRAGGAARSPGDAKLFVRGLVLGTALSALGAMLFIGPLMALITGLIAMLVESVSTGMGVSRVLDDNLTIPVAAGTAMAWIGL